MKNLKHFRWLFIPLALLVTAGMAKVAINNVIYLPVVILEPSITPSFTSSPTSTATPTATSTATATTTATSTKTPTSTPKPSGVEILSVVQSETTDPLNEYVSIHNYSSSPISLSGWFIRDDGDNRYDFPNEFSIAASKTVYIWSKSGTDTDTNLYWGSEVEVWNDVHDCAYLRDDSEGEKELVDVYCYSQSADGSLIISHNSSDN